MSAGPPCKRTFATFSVFGSPSLFLKWLSCFTHSDTSLTLSPLINLSAGTQAPPPPLLYSMVLIDYRVLPANVPRQLLPERLLALIQARRCLKVELEPRHIELFTRCWVT